MELSHPNARISLFVLCFFSSAFGGTVSTLMSVYLPVVVQEFRVSEGGGQINLFSGYINALFIFGWALGGFSWGMISDKIGRKPSLLLAIACYGLFTVLTGLSFSWWSVMLCRALTGFGVGGVLVVSFTLLSEVWPAKSKAVVTGIISIAFPVGIFSAGAINYAISTWREGFLIGVFPLILALAGYWLLKESQVWIGHRNNPEKAIEPKLFSKGNSKALTTGAIIFGSMLIGLWAIFSWLPTWIQSLIQTDAHRERGLSMMCLGVGGLAGGFFSGWLVKWAGFRPSLISCFAVCSALSFLLFMTNHRFSTLIYVEIAVLALFFGVSQGILAVYIPQLFTTGIRAAATGFCFNAGRLVTAVAIVFIGMLVKTLGGYGNALFIFSMVFIVGLIATVNLKNLPLRK